MSDPVKYLSLVAELLETYQAELILQLKKMPLKDFKGFMSKITDHVRKLKQVQDDKGIHENKISDLCRPMTQFLAISSRPAHTSQSQRYAIRASLMSQEGNRMRFTGGFKKNHAIQRVENDIIEESQGELDDIIHSYRIQDQLVPRMRMKWKSFQHENQGKAESKERGTIGDNNIDLLSYTIPEIQNSIKRLSLQSRHMKKEKSPERTTFDAYRTIDTRVHNRRKYVPRLI